MNGNGKARIVPVSVLVECLEHVGSEYSGVRVCVEMSGGDAHQVTHMDHGLSVDDSCLHASFVIVHVSGMEIKQHLQTVFHGAVAGACTHKHTHTHATDEQPQ